jgi:hypothetical protein
VIKIELSSRLGEMTNACLLVGKSRGNGVLTPRWHRWKDDTEIVLTGLKEGVDVFQGVHDRVQWRALVQAAVHLQFR